MTDSLKILKTHECVSELRQCAFCQVEQAAERKCEDLMQILKDKWQASLNILEGEFLLIKN